jgi:hypothetical protein
MLTVTLRPRSNDSSVWQVKGSETTFMSNAPRFPKEHCLLEGCQGSPVYPSGKSDM